MDDEPCPYQVLAPIGEGSSGVTYLAQALTGVGGYVALKILRPRDDVDAVLSRYQHWKAALARIQHPGVGKLLDVGLTADGLLYVASEYVAGWPLTALGSHASMGTDERVEIARQLTAAIDAAHAAGVVHLKLDCLESEDLDGERPPRHDPRSRLEPHRRRRRRAAGHRPPRPGADPSRARRVTFSPALSFSTDWRRIP